MQISITANPPENLILTLSTVVQLLGSTPDLHDVQQTGNIYCKLFTKIHQEGAKKGSTSSAMLSHQFLHKKKGSIKGFFTNLAVCSYCAELYSMWKD